jgi:hypothetical protein
MIKIEINEVKTQFSLDLAKYLSPLKNRSLNSKIYQRNHLLKTFINCSDLTLKTEIHNRYKLYRNRIVDLIRISKKSHFSRYFEINLSNTKKIWEGIRSIIGNSNKSCKDNLSLKINNVATNDHAQIVNHFNNFFTSVADKIRNKIPPTNKQYTDYLKNVNHNSFFFSPVDKEEIKNYIKDLNPHKADGPNSIPHKFFEVSLDTISSILSKILNISFQTGTYPDSLKTVKVVPIFKNKGSPLEVSNYRPISLLSNIDKIFEKAVKKRIISFLDHNNIICDKQFGFRSKHSTNHALISLTETIRKQLDSGNFSCGVFIDLQKAFDTVDHQILLGKLGHYGIRGIANSWFRSYLHQRKQFVSVSGCQSLLKNIIHGVPQGSVLGPLLFLLYINDLSNAILYSEVFHFADDTSLICSNSSLKAIKKRVNIDLKLLYHWLNANKISLNVSKTDVILFRHKNKQINYDVRLKLNGNKLFFSPFVKYLGVLLDPHLSWKFHTSDLAAKLRRTNGAISKLRHYVPRKTLISVYHALFLSHASYACQIWGQNINPNLNRIVKLQKACIRLITFSTYRHPSKPLLHQLGLLNLPDTINLYNISLIYQILNLLAPIDICNLFSLSYQPNTHLTRGSSKKLLKKPMVTNFGIHSISFQSILIWNIFQNANSHDLSSISLSKLKTQFKHYLLSQYISN